MPPGDDNVDYLRTKRDKMGHMLHHQDLRFDEDVRQRRDRAVGEVDA